MDGDHVGPSGATENEGEAVSDAPVQVAVVGSRIEAEFIAGLLRSHGMRAAVVTDDAGGQEPQWQLNGVRVLVPAADEPEARRLLATVEDGAPLSRGRGRGTEHQQTIPSERRRT